MKREKEITQVERPSNINIHVWKVLRKVAREIKKEEGQGNPWKNNVLVSCKAFYDMLLDENGELILSNTELIRFSQNAHIKKWANDLLLEGINLYANKEMQLAENKFMLYNSMMPNTGIGLYYLAKTQKASMRPKKAIESINHAIEIEAKNAKYYTFRASVWSSIDQDERAMSDLNFALLLEPISSKALFLRASLRKVKGQTQAAISDLKKAIEINPSELKNYSLLGNLYLELDRLPEAYRAFRMLLSENPFNAEALFQCATIKIALDVEKSTAEEELWMARSLGHPRAEELLINTFYPGWDLPLSRVA